MRAEHHRNAGKDDGTRRGIKKMAEIVAVADFTPAVRQPEDIAAPPARRQAHPRPKARDKWVSASVTESIEDIVAFHRRGRPPRPASGSGDGSSSVDGNSRRITAIEAQAAGRGLKVPVLIDYIQCDRLPRQGHHRPPARQPSHPAPSANRQLLRVLHSHAKAVASHPHLRRRGNPL